MLTREWATLAEFAGMELPMVPERRALQDFAAKHEWTRADRRNRVWRRRSGSGGGIEYHYTVLNRDAQIEWVRRYSVLTVEAERALVEECDKRFADEWTHFHDLSKKKKDMALRRLGILDQWHRLVKAGFLKGEAMNEVLFKTRPRISRSTFMGWRRCVEFVPRNHWLPMLVDRRVGVAGRRADCDQEAYAAFKSLFMRPERPAGKECYRTLLKMAPGQGWEKIPSLKTLERWMKKDVTTVAMAIAREGRSAANEMIPFQERSVAHMHALMAVNADGHKWDVFVEGPDGKRGRPIMVCWHDIYSRMILAWRVEWAETADLIQLAFGDMVEKYGIPEKAYLDNGRAFASKQMTGGKKTRYRFKYQEDEIRGVMTTLGCEPIFVNPYSGRSKPIERAFRDFANDIAKDVRFAGAYVGNSPVNKPDNYGEKAIPLADFLSVVSERIREHNEREGRETEMARGKYSFRQVFEDSYARSIPRKATAAQRHLWLRTAVNVTARSARGEIVFMGNRYWAEFLLDHRGEKLTVRYDPERLHDDLHIYSIGGQFLGNAPVIEKTGYDHSAQAAVDARKRREILKANKVIAEANASVPLRDLVDMLPVPPEEEAPAEPKLVRPFRPAVSGNAAVAVREEAFLDGPPAAEIEEQERNERFRNNFRLIQGLAE